MVPWSRHFHLDSQPGHGTHGGHTDCHAGILSRKQAVRGHAAASDTRSRWLLFRWRRILALVRGRHPQRAGHHLHGRGQRCLGPDRGRRWWVPLDHGWQLHISSRLSSLCSRGKHCLCPWCWRRWPHSCVLCHHTRCRPLREADVSDRGHHCIWCRSRGRHHIHQLRCNLQQHDHCAQSAGQHCYALTRSPAHWHPRPRGPVAVPGTNPCQ